MTHLHIIFRSRYCSGRNKLTTQLTTNLISMSTYPIYSAFMDVILNTLTLMDTYYSYGVHSRIIKNLLTKFEAHQHKIISKENKLLVEKSSRFRSPGGPKIDYMCNREIIRIQNGIL